MVEYCVSKNYFSKLTLLSDDGRESDIYLVPDVYEEPMCIKEYSASFFLSNETEEVVEKLLYLDQHKEIFDNIVPSIIFYDIEEYQKGIKKIIGIGITYLANYISINEVTDKYKLAICLKNLINKLIQMTKTKIYPTDLNNSNILISEDLDVQIIDLDGHDCKVGVESIDNYKTICSSIRFRIITDLLLSKEEYNQAYKYPSFREGEKDILLNKGHDAKIVNIILNDDSNLEDMLAVLEELIPLFPQVKSII